MAWAGHLVSECARRAKTSAPILREGPAPVAALAFPDRRFDVVVIAFGLHDMPPRVRVRVLAEAARVTAGRLVVADYDVASGRFRR